MKKFIDMVEVGGELSMEMHFATNIEGKSINIQLEIWNLGLADKITLNISPGKCFGRGQLWALAAFFKWEFSKDDAIFISIENF